MPYANGIFLYNFSVFQDLGPGCQGLPQKHVETAHEGQRSAGYWSSKFRVRVSKSCFLLLMSGTLHKISILFKSLLHLILYDFLNLIKRSSK
jgi:hypothetical protein